MKLSDKILEEFQAQVKYYEDVINNNDVIGNKVFETFKIPESLTQAYKDALFEEMEQEWAKASGQTNATKE